MILATAWIGHRVILPLPPSGLRVSGVTSRGVFLFTPDQNVIFLSAESCPGPLTINLSLGQLPSCQVGETVRLADDRLIFSTSSVDLATAQRWQPPPPPTRLAAHATRVELLRAVASEILARAPRAGLAPLLGPLFGLPSPPLDPSLGHAGQALNALPADPAAALISLLGLGRGLTPSGDDLVAGYLLVAARSNAARLEIASRVTTAAFERTTTLSAALISAAAAGSADERILHACDALLTASASPAEIFSLLSAYGSSSGLDAFVGISAQML